MLVSAVTSWLSAPIRSVWLPGTDASEERPDQSVVIRTAPLSGCGVLCRSSFAQPVSCRVASAKISNLPVKADFMIGIARLSVRIVILSM